MRKSSDPHNAEELFEARVRGRVVLLADWFIVGVVVLGVGVEGMFEQLPSLLGRHLEHCLLAFTQAQPLHEPVRLQHSTISPSRETGGYESEYNRITKTERQLFFCPLLYNCFMGGVDVVDQHLVYYAIGRKGLKWWRR